MCRTKPIPERLRKDDSGISSVECAMLLALIAGGIIMAADMLSKSVMGQFSETAGLFDVAAGDGCGNDGGGDGTGGDVGSGQGGDRTC